MSGLYVKARLAYSTRVRLRALQATLDLKYPVPEDDLHVTIVYSKADVPGWTSAGIINELAMVDDYAIMDGKNGKALALLIKSPWLDRRHAHAASLGATYDFPTYRPHITLGHDVDKLSIAGMNPPALRIGLMQEVARALRKDEL